MFNFYFVLLTSISVTLISIVYSFHTSFYKKPILEYVILAGVDTVLSCLVVFIVILKNKSLGSLSLTRELIKNNYQSFVAQAKFLIFFLLLYSLYLAYKSFSLIILGAVRQELIGEYGTMGFGYMFVSSFFKILFPFALLFKSNVYSRIFIFLGFFSTMLITGSRSELTYAGYLLLTLAIFTPDKRIFIKLFLTMLLFLLFGLFITVFAQNRPIEDGIMGLVSVFDKHFFYRAYSIHLSEISIAASSSFEKVLYPLFGYPLEWIIAKLWSLDIPIGSEYISQYHSLGIDPLYGREYIANVVYPWWSWFVGAYGVLGLIVKALYCYLLLILAKSLKLPITFVYIACYVLFIGQSGTLLMTLNSVIVLSFAVLIDLLGKYKVKFSV